MPEHLERDRRVVEGLDRIPLRPQKHATLSGFNDTIPVSWRSAMVPFKPDLETYYDGFTPLQLDCRACGIFWRTVAGAHRRCPVCDGPGREVPPYQRCGRGRPWPAPLPMSTPPSDPAALCRWLDIVPAEDMTPRELTAHLNPEPKEPRWPGGLASQSQMDEYERDVVAWEEGT